MSDCFSCILFGKCSHDPTYCHSWDTKVAEGGAICRGHLYTARGFADWCDKIEAADKEISAENVKLKKALQQIKNRSIEVDTMIGENDAYDCEVVYKDALYDIDKIASAALGQEASK